MHFPKTFCLSNTDIMALQPPKMPVVYRVGRPIGRKVLKIMFGKFPQLFGSYYCYLLPKEDGGTSQNITFKILPPTGRASSC